MERQCSKVGIAMEARFSIPEVISTVLRTVRLSRKIGTRSAILFERARGNRNEPESARIVRLTLPDFPSPFYLRGGTSDVEVFDQIFLNNEYDVRSFPQFEKIDDAYSKAVARGRRPLIIDCGANIGLSSVWFSRLFPEAQIVAIEPAAGNIEIAKRNLSSYQNVVLFQGAVWDRETQVTISDTAAAPWAYQVAETQTGILADSDNTMRAFTIPKVMEMVDAIEVLIVKIDIEGAEATLFRSNTDWVGLTDLIIIELHDWMLPKQRTSAPFIRSLANLDFDLVQRGENLFVFLNKPGK
jgi:FkbM family methyltransferase